jgi:hypothetical protein
MFEILYGSILDLVDLLFITGQFLVDGLLIHTGILSKSEFLFNLSLLLILGFLIFVSVSSRREPCIIRLDLLGLFEKTVIHNLLGTDYLDLDFLGLLGRTDQLQFFLQNRLQVVLFVLFFLKTFFGQLFFQLLLLHNFVNLKEAMGLLFGLQFEAIELAGKVMDFLTLD